LWKTSLKLLHQTCKNDKITKKNEIDKIAKFSTNELSTNEFTPVIPLVPLKLANISKFSNSKRETPHSSRRPFLTQA
jgi:hypothetical protein